MKEHKMSEAREILEQRLREIGLSDQQVTAVVDAVKDWVLAIFNK